MSRSVRGFTLVELLMAVAVIGILAAIAMVSITAARMSANEASATGSLRSVNSGQQVFWSTCGNGSFSPSLQNLGIPVAGTPFISQDLGGPAPVIKSGYQIDLGTANPSPLLSCNGGTTATTYHVTADFQPSRGRWYYGSNGNGAIFQSPNSLTGVMPDDQPPPAPAIPLQH